MRKFEGFDNDFFYKYKQCWDTVLISSFILLIKGLCVIEIIVSIIAWIKDDNVVGFWGPCHMWNCHSYHWSCDTVLDRDLMFYD